MCKKKTVYWDLINSDMNRRDVQTGYSGYVKKKKKKKTGYESMDVFSVTILWVIMRLGLCLGA